MASTFSPILRIELIGTGDQSGTWGNTTNVNLGTLIEQAIAGTASIDVTVGNVTLTNYNGTTDEARCMALRVSGTPGTSRNIIAPAVSKIYVIANGSNAAVVLKTSTSTGLTVPSGEVYLAYYDPTVGTADFRLVGRASSSANTANTLVLRDGSGNFAAGTITANLTGDVTGNLTGNSTGAHNGTVGAGTPNTGAFTTLSSTGNTTLGDASGDTLTVNATPTFNVAIPVSSGGTGSTSVTANSVMLGNGTSALSGNLVAPSTSGNVLTSNGTTWTSAAPIVQTPSGAVMYFAMNTAPTGWLVANGTAVSRTTYAALFAAIGTTFGSGDGSTTFNLPELRGEFIRTWDNGRGVDSGRVFGSYQVPTEFSAYVNQAQHIWVENGDSYRPGSVVSVDGDAGYSHTQDFYSTRPRNVALLACIKV